MNDFYRALADHYDTIFPEEKIIVDFLEKHLETRHSILDLACGTGTYSEALASLGHRVTGVEIDEAMIRKAIEKRRAAETEYVAADMIDGIGSVQGSYDAALCIGNSLPHLQSLGDVSRAFDTWNRALVPGGVLLIQLVNFDRFAGGSAADLPEIDNGGFTFRRKYTPLSAGSILFSTELMVPGRADPLRNELELLVIPKARLSSLLRDAGFVPNSWFGGYDGSAYVEDTSFLTICIAGKQ